MLIGSSGGGNTESGRISLLMDSARRCAITEGLQRANSICCPPLRVYGSPVNQGAYLQGKIDTITSSNLQLQMESVPNSNNYLPAVFVPESVRISRLQEATLSAQPRFAEYIRFNPLPACPPLPATAINAGNPIPSFNSCLP
jgi:hypothetical protein